MARPFLEHFPGDVLYAVKCNPSRHVVQGLYEAGIRHFDAASLPEIEGVSQLLGSGGEGGVTSYFMHPVKSREAIRAAFDDHRVRHYVIDHVSELDKLAALLPASRDVVILVRLAVHHDGAVYDLSSKFGASVDEGVELLRSVEQRGFAPGLAYHVGSQCMDIGAWHQGLAHVGDVIRASGVAPSCLDVGGGFPGSYLNSPAGDLSEALKDIAAGIARLSLPADCQLLCEPGRALSIEAESLIVQVQLRKGDSIYLNDGMYGSMVDVKWGLQLPLRMVATRQFESETRSYRAFGPTCDSVDVYPDPLMLPADIQEGDWIEMGRIGAYGSACRTHFNGFFPDSFVEVESEFGVGDPQ